MQNYETMDRRNNDIRVYTKALYIEAYVGLYRLHSRIFFP